MATKKTSKTASAMDAFIRSGKAELEEQTPGQRGIRVPLEEKGNKGKEGTKKRFTVNLDTELIARVQRAAWWERITLSAIVEDALGKELDRLEKKRGEPYPDPAAPPRKGRPVGSRS